MSWVIIVLCLVLKIRAKNVFVHNRQMKMISLKFVAPIQAASSTKFSVPLAGALWSVTSLSLSLSSIYTCCNINYTPLFSNIALRGAVLTILRIANR